MAASSEAQNYGAAPQNGEDSSEKRAEAPAGDNAGNAADAETSNAAEAEASSVNPPLPEAPPPIALEDDSQAAVLSGIPNSDAMTDTPEIIGANDIPGYASAMNAAQRPSKAKGNKQLIESLRDVFPLNGNPLKDLFRPQPQYVTPQTLMNPHALPRYCVKERLPDHFFIKDAAGNTRPTDKIETPLGPARAADNSANANTHTLRQAMLLIDSAREGDEVALMDRLLVQYPGNFQARYVKAVALVRLRRFAEARDEYQRILQFSSDPALKTLAQEGMTKLDQ